MPRRASAGTRASALIAQKLAALTLRVDKQLYFATRPIAKPEVLPVPTRHGTVRCLVYLPHLDAPLHGHGGEKPHVHVQLHGGAFMIRVPSQDTHLNNYIASEVGAVVINPTTASLLRSSTPSPKSNATTSSSGSTATGACTGGIPLACQPAGRARAGNWR